MWGKMWGKTLCSQKEEGAYRVLEILRDETDTLMAQLGLRSIDEIGSQTEHCVWDVRDCRNVST